MSCPLSAAWHSSVAAHWSKYHCYKQAPSRYDLRYLKAMLNPNKQKSILAIMLVLLRLNRNSFQLLTSQSKKYMYVQKDLLPLSSSARQNLTLYKCGFRVSLKEYSDPIHIGTLLSVNTIKSNSDYF